LFTIYQFYRAGGLKPTLNQTIGFNWYFQFGFGPTRSKDKTS
jgi:hypothetical protein